MSLHHVANRITRVHRGFVLVLEEQVDSPCLMRVHTCLTFPISHGVEIHWLKQFVRVACDSCDVYRLHDTVFRACSCSSDSVVPCVAPPPLVQRHVS